MEAEKREKKYTTYRTGGRGLASGRGERPPAESEQQQ